MLFEKSTSSNSTAKTFQIHKNTIFVSSPSLKFFEWGLGKIFFEGKVFPTSIFKHFNRIKGIDIFTMNRSYF